MAKKAISPVQLLDSPSGQLQLIFELKDGIPTYRLNKGADFVILSSDLGVVLEDEDLSKNFEIIGYGKRDSSSTWTKPWGEVKKIVDNKQE